MSIKMFLIETIQPIGTFYIGKVNSTELIKMSHAISRSSGNGVQRDLKKRRTKEISGYCKDPDATFPTPIILAVNSTSLKEQIKLLEGTNYIYEAIFNESSAPFAEILDGQHRLEGIKLAENFECDMSVAIMFDLTEEEKAYIFSTINSNQEKVDRSLIYELFELSIDRSPYKTCHEIARSMNSDNSSPFYGKLKMLGKAETQRETLSQGTFVDYLCKLISKNPKDDMIKLKNKETLEEDDACVLREFFIDEKDEVILKIITNYFSAVKETFPIEWEDSTKYILSKTAGYGALLKAFPEIYKLCIEKANLSTKSFLDIFKVVQKSLIQNNIDLTTDSVKLGELGQSNLAKAIIDSLDVFV